jgi:hypothetical protein
MKTLPVLGFAALVALLLSSCETKSEHPLASSETATVDSQLIGDWHDKEDEDTFHITATDAHWMHVTVTPKPSDQPSTISHSPQDYNMFVTEIGDNHFLNIVMFDQDRGIKPVKSYVFLRYTVSPDHVLHLWSLSQEASAAAVRAGKLKGTIHQDAHPLMVGTPPHPDIDVTIEDTSEKLNSFVEAADVDALFTEPMSDLYPGQPPVD